jgi:hypothetical protein
MRVQEVYKRHAPSLADGASGGTDLPLEDQIDATALFRSVFMMNR